MKKTVLLLSITFIFFSSFAQPAAFSWDARHGYDYIKPAQDQMLQGPCQIFATVAAVEAIAHIYYNKGATGGAGLNLSEKQLYNESGCGIGCGSSSVGSALNLFKTSGVIDEYSFQFPTNTPFCSYDGYTAYRTKVTIPEWTVLNNIDSTNDLKKAIMDYGPIIMSSAVENPPEDRIGNILHPNDPDNDRNHTVLVIGWESDPVFKWKIKDSWPGAPNIYTCVVDFFNFNPTFSRVYPVYNNQTISCEGEYCSSIFTISQPVDGDHDGFYNWGFESTPKPSSCSGPDLMDFDDANAAIIFRDGYTPLAAPTLTGPTGTVCNEQVTFTLHNVPSLFIY